MTYRPRHRPRHRGTLYAAAGTGLALIAAVAVTVMTEDSAGVRASNSPPRLSGSTSARRTPNSGERVDRRR